MVLRNSTLVLNSKDRDVLTDNTNNFYITLARPVFNVVKAEFRYFFLENGIWNVDSTGNEFNVLLAPFGGGSGTYSGLITIPPGYYSSVGLTNALQTQFDDLHTGAVDIVEVSPSNTIVIKSTTHSIQVSFGIAGVGAVCAKLLGFPTGISNSTLVGSQHILESPYEVSLSAYPYIYLQSSKLQNQLLTSSGLNAFAVVPMTTSLQGIGNSDVALGATYDAGAYPMDASYFTQPITLDRIDIRLVDDRGNPLDTRSNDVAIVVKLASTV